MNKYQGIAISKGIAMGEAHLIVEQEVQLHQGFGQDPIIEIQRFHDARNQAISQVQEIYEKTLIEIGKDEATIFEAHICLLEDIEINDQVEAYLMKHECLAQWAINEVAKSIIAIFENLDSEYMRERAADIKDIFGRLLDILLEKDKSNEVLSKPSILVAHDLTPSQTSSLDTKKVLGIITEVGGKTSHSAIIASLLKIPYMVLEESLKKIQSGNEILFDGREGVLYVEPNDITKEIYKSKQDALNQENLKFESIKGLPCRTKDGKAVELAANIGQTSDIEYVRKSEAKSIGLFRTEFIFMDQEELPDEEKQFEIYKEIVTSITEGSVTIRTLDIGGDKSSTLFNILKEDNPFLGFRGIRLCLEEKQIFKTQLRAILRVSVFGKVKIMFPMISSMKELESAKDLLKECMSELSQENIDFDRDIPVGMMMETPAATIMADQFAKEVDFFSIGTNDLIQYTMAVDRMNAKVAKLYCQYDPAILRSIQMISNAAKKENITVSICGEAAADIELLPYWIGLGINTLSMSTALIPEVKWNIHRIDSTTAMQLNEAIWQQKSADEIKNLLKTDLID